MKVDQRKKVSAFQEQFKAEFGVGVRVYKGAKLAPDVALKSLTEKGTRGGAIDFGGGTKVKNVETAFKEEMGIKIQIENKKGALADNNATLASLKK
ncbi:MAG: hypothetical protein P8M26_10395 [Gammaproteobacteria bacterium]|nr:hypothetical protein [Gammaproteobacteria bacterium]